MSQSAFFDSNILVYTDDASAPQLGVLHHLALGVEKIQPPYHEILDRAARYSAGCGS
jgi:hypothetical protein